MDAREIVSKWITSIDEHARRANTDADLMDRSFTNGSDPDVAAANALRSIASQLAYANVIAAASFYMANRLHIILDDEGGSE